MDADENGNQVIQINKEWLTFIDNIYSHEGNDSGFKSINDASPMFCAFISPGGSTSKDDYEDYNGRYSFIVYAIFYVLILMRLCLGL
jgi:hypothetical protein